MATDLDATIGGAESNSYITLADANAYFGDDPNRAEEWERHDPAQRERALLMAARYLQRVRFRGTPLGASQALHFPTNETLDRQGDLYIPLAVRYAQAEWALDILENPSAQRIDRAALRSQGVEAFSRPGVQEKLASGPALPLPPIPCEAYAFLRPWLAGPGPTRVA